MNAITIYLGMKMISFRHTSHFLFKGAAGWFGSYEGFVLVLAALICQWVFLYVLYRKKIFLRA